MDQLVNNSVADSPLVMAGVIAYTLLWTATYVFVIWRGFKDKSYGVPLVNICLNISWEFIFSWIYPDPNMTRTWLYRFWFIPDVIIIWQLWKYGRENQVIPEIKKYFHTNVIVTLILSYLCIWTFIHFYKDPTGTEIAFYINAWMSIGYVFMFFNRRDLRGISLPAAWCKMLGTGIASIVVHFTYSIIKPDKPTWGILELSFITIFIFDVIYIYLITKRAKEIGHKFWP